MDGLIAWLSNVQEDLESSSHTLSNMRFARRDDYAESECRGITYLCLKGSPPQNVMVVGRHFDKYERREGVWGFTHRALCVDWVQLMPRVDAEFDLTGAVEPGKMGPDDPFYSRLELLPGTVKTVGTARGN
ncbi:nuclear transport factor 2 family protein [Kineobactrum salinum]|uniref:SnoaL-like domain-containing protein n=1 Tax=Kineobactrum salinum TaxID=2708301 RepID=A0A6C0U8I6_9GAMM|nr:hypothetical protein G3T16_16970 [Kineobactrum salinum]